MKDALALALVHFVWQGALLAIVGALLMRVTKVPTVRYAIGVATMLAMLLAPVMTFLAIQNGYGMTPAAPEQRTVMSRHAAASGASEPLSLSSASAPLATNAAPGSPIVVIVPATWIVSVWAVGVMLLSLRFVGGWAVARRMATQTLAPVGGDLQALAAQLAARLNVHGAFRVCESASVAVPMMIGWLRPVVVLPPAALAGLPLAQLEALLAHELAHIRRHDYLVNLLQTGVETICFYHPAVWWTSREVRRHREHCCDDVAVGVCDRLTYVTALSSLASITTTQFALSAAGGSLRDRVRRLIEPTPHSASPKGAWIAMLPILLVISLVAPHAWGAQATTPAVAAAVAQAAPGVQVTPVEEARRVVRSTTPTTAAEVARRERDEQVRRRARQSVERQVEARRERLDTARATAGRATTERARAARREVDSRVRTRATETARATEARREAQEVTQEVGRRQLLRARGENELAMLESKLRLAEATLSRQKELAEKGLATRQSLVAAEEELTQLKIQLEQARLQKTTERELLHNLESRELDQRFRELAERGSVTHRNLSSLDSNAALEPQDRLTITIDGEPDLPTMYPVRADGSIRFPFLGSIRVQGSTSSQVQSAIQKLISDRGLARNPVVTVSAGRNR